jgi:hypothetical protein
MRHIRVKTEAKTVFQEEKEMETVIGFLPGLSGVFSTFQSSLPAGMALAIVPLFAMLACGFFWMVSRLFGSY